MDPPQTSAQPDAQLDDEQRAQLARVLTDPVALAELRQRMPDVLKGEAEQSKPNAREVARAVMRGEKDPLVTHETAARQRETGIMQTLDQLEDAVTGVRGGLEGFGGAPVAGEEGLRKRVVRAGDAARGRPTPDATVVCHLVCKRADGTKYDSTRERVRRLCRCASVRTAGDPRAKALSVGPDAQPSRPRSA